MSDAVNPAALVCLKTPSYRVSSCYLTPAQAWRRHLSGKDSIIRVRNAQIAALWDELHTRQPWKNALEGESLVSLPDEAAKNASRALVVFGINTVSPAGRALV